MSEQHSSDIEISGPWAWGLTGFFLAAGALMVASTQGAGAVQTLMYCSLIGLFLCCGVFVGLLSTQALGAFFRIGEAEAESANAISNSFESENAVEDRTVDPFYEILKRNSTSRRAA